MRHPTKRQCSAYEKMVMEVLTSVLGEPKPSDRAEVKEWSMAHDTGHVHLTFFCESAKSGRTTGSPWLAGRLDDPKYIGEDRYTIPSGHPHPFSHHSGKCNLHPSNINDIALARSEFIAYMCAVSDKSHREKFSLVA